MTLWQTIKYWWVCKHSKKTMLYGDYIVIPPNATNVREVRRKLSEGINSYGVKWDVKPKDKLT